MGLLPLAAIVTIATGDVCVALTALGAFDRHDEAACHAHEQGHDDAHGHGDLSGGEAGHDHASHAHGHAYKEAHGHAHAEAHGHAHGGAPAEELEGPTIGLSDGCCGLAGQARGFVQLGGASASKQVLKPAFAGIHADAALRYPVAGPLSGVGRRVLKHAWRAHAPPPDLYLIYQTLLI